ncbi:hypothetical protein BDW22DRAFT_302038 [Trametopsis cervina]|nr:hypothetical protein BDW22DRAFT_302038 [Trametopsis cervina]
MNHLHPCIEDHCFINRLPDEIFAQIFEELYCHHISFCSRTQGSPLIPTHVCRRWRAISISLPSIWKCIHIDTMKPSNYEHILGLYLERSEPLPLSIFLSVVSRHLDPQWSRFAGGEEWTRIVKHWNLILAHRYRWQHLSCVWQLHEVARSLMGTLQLSELPQLTQLHVLASSDLPSIVEMEEWTVDVPRLTELSLSNTILRFGGSMLLNVKEMTLRDQGMGTDQDYLRTIAAGSPKLEMLCLWSLATRRLRLASFPALRHLHLHSCGPWVMPAIDAPLVDTIRIADPFLDYSSLGLQAERYESLRQLELAYCRPALMKRYIGAFASASVVRVYKLCSDWINILAEDLNVLPSLTVISISYSRAENINLPPLPMLDILLSSRATPYGSLRTFKLDCDPYEDRLMQALAAFPQVEVVKEISDWYEEVGY